MLPLLTTLSCPPPSVWGSCFHPWVFRRTYKAPTRCSGHTFTCAEKCWDQFRPLFTSHGRQFLLPFVAKRIPWHRTCLRAIALISGIARWCHALSCPATLKAMAYRGGFDGGSQSLPGQWARYLLLSGKLLRLPFPVLAQVSRTATCLMLQVIMYELPLLPYISNTPWIAGLSASVCE